MLKTCLQYLWACLSWMPERQAMVPHRRSVHVLRGRPVLRGGYTRPAIVVHAHPIEPLILTGRPGGSWTKFVSRACWKRPPGRLELPFVNTFLVGAGLGRQPRNGADDSVPPVAGYA